MMATAHMKVLRTVPNFPNYTPSMFGYPERVDPQETNSLVILGPPIHLYNFQPLKGCTVHVSGIPDWATMADMAEVFDSFGKIFSIVLAVKFNERKRSPGILPSPSCKGWAYVTYVSMEGAQRALSSHLTKSIPGMVMPFSIYKGIASRVVLLKNLPSLAAKSDIITRLSGYPGLVTIHFMKATVARVVFKDLDSALLFMDIVSGGGIVIDGFTASVEPEDKDELDDE